MTLGNLAGYLKWVERVDVKYTWCSASTETVRLFRDRGGGGMEVGGEGDYIPITTLSPPE